MIVDDHRHAPPAGVRGGERRRGCGPRSAPGTAGAVRRAARPPGAAAAVLVYSAHQVRQLFHHRWASLLRLCLPTAVPMRFTQTLYRASYSNRVWLTTRIKISEGKETDRAIAYQSRVSWLPLRARGRERKRWTASHVCVFFIHLIHSLKHNKLIQTLHSAGPYISEHNTQY